MASDKIINKILESANQEAEETLQKGETQAQEEVKKIEKDTQNRIEQLNNQFDQDRKTILKREELNARIEERKNLLEDKREVLNKAFDLARERIKDLPEKEWRHLITQIVLAATDTDTEYLKVPEKDMVKYTTPDQSKKTFLEELNLLLAENGHHHHLKLDRDPAKFSDGVMLIGKYSDVNASFDVLIQNMREELEWDVTQILFPPEAVHE